MQREATHGRRNGINNSKRKHLAQRARSEGLIIVARFKCVRKSPFTYREAVALLQKERRERPNQTGVLNYLELIN